MNDKSEQRIDGISYIYYVHAAVNIIIIMVLRHCSQVCNTNDMMQCSHPYYNLQQGPAAHVQLLGTGLNLEKVKVGS